MTQESYEALLPYICTDLVALIADKQGIQVEEAIVKLYSSQLYRLLEDEEMKVWQYSTPMLYSLFEQELITGEIIFPDV